MRNAGCYGIDEGAGREEGGLMGARGRSGCGLSLQYPALDQRACFVFLFSVSNRANYNDLMRFFLKIHSMRIFVVLRFLQFS